MTAVHFSKFSFLACNIHNIMWNGNVSLGKLVQSLTWKSYHYTQALNKIPLGAQQALNKIPLGAQRTRLQIIFISIDSAEYQACVRFCSELDIHRQNSAPQEVYHESMEDIKVNVQLVCVS